MSLILDKKTHTYYLDNIEKISVSKIINNYLGASYYCDKCEIDISNCTCDNYCTFCDNVKNASYRGNLVHKCAELYFKNINKYNDLQELKEKIIFKISPFCKGGFTSYYCLRLLEYLINKFNNNNQEFISEQIFSNDIVAGTPDLIFKNDYLDLYSIIDFKTYKVMTKELRIKTELQLTAYHWLLLNNGYKLSNIHFIVWIQQDKVETISIEITKEKLQEWEFALNKFKENNNV